MNTTKRVKKLINTKRHLRTAKEPCSSLDRLIQMVKQIQTIKIKLELNNLQSSHSFEYRKHSMIMVQ